jgi:diguanylate cyclase (GGDEF)-like protein/PAS domain S-box-containing protein
METQTIGLARFHTLIESPHAGVIGTDEDGTVRYCSARAAAIFGYAEGDVVGAKVADLIVADNRAGPEGETQAHLNATGQRAGGVTFPIDLTVVSIKIGTTSSLIWIVRERSLTDVPYEDALTKLPSRDFACERLRERLEQAQINQRSLALLIVGLGGIDAINRSLGRSAGDAALLEAAQRLRQGAPGADIIGRLGGAEFCVVLADGAGATELESLARALAESLAYNIDAGGEAVRVAPKIGIALAPADGTDVATLIAHAQTALDRAKHGDSALCFYSAEVSDRLRARRDLQTAIRAALDKKQFSLAFLPLIDLATGNVAGVEALLRWHHPERGEIKPLDFIPLAEECGLMVPIGTWVLREGLRCLKRWNDAGRTIRLAVNLSARQLHAPSFVRQLSASLKASGCKPEWLELELTEGVAMQHAATVQLVLTDVRRLGVRVALDDFGTGYSSMAYLKSLPVDIIKIDRSFVDGVPTDNDDSSIVRAIVAFALCTGREVRAEGVTNIGQARWLHAEGCDAAQGFFFSKPIPEAEFDTWLAAYEAEGIEEST